MSEFAFELFEHGQKALVVFTYGNARVPGSIIQHANGRGSTACWRVSPRSMGDVSRVIIYKQNQTDHDLFIGTFIGVPRGLVGDNGCYRVILTDMLDAGYTRSNFRHFTIDPSRPNSRGAALDRGYVTRPPA